jgi:hypothetical protein
MATLTLRSLKGSPLSNTEVDLNFTALNLELEQKLFIDDFTPGAILTRLRNADGIGSGLDSDFVRGLELSTDPLPNTIAQRSVAGNLSANLFLAVTGFQGNLVGNVTGNVSGTASGLSQILAVTSGGTGAPNAASARINLGLGNIATQNINAVNLTGGQITGMSLVAATNLTGYLTGSVSGTSDNIRGVAAVVNGGTGATTPVQARANLGLVIGSNVQAWSTTLDSLANPSTDGLLGKYLGQVRNLTIVPGSNISVVNGNGKIASGNISVGLNPSITLNSVSATSLFGTLTGNVTGNLTGNASTATTASRLKSARNIGGVSFDGSANINLPGVNTQGNQNTTGNAATATKLQTARTINGVSFNGTQNITVFDATKIGTAGGTVTGRLYLNNSPVSGTEATNKFYVDTRIPNYLVTSGTNYSISGFTNQVGSWNFSRNYFDIFPPSGRTMSNLAAFIPSIHVIHFAGGVDGNDSLVCTWSNLGDRIRVYVQNTEQRSSPAANWLAFWST